MLMSRNMAAATVKPKEKMTCLPVEPLSVNMGDRTGIVWRVVKLPSGGTSSSAKFSSLFVKETRSISSQACIDSECNYVLTYMPVSSFKPMKNGLPIDKKMSSTEKLKQIKTEIEDMILLSTLEIGAKVYDAWMCDQGGAYVSEKLEIGLRDYLNSNPEYVQKQSVKIAIKDLIFRMHDAGFFTEDITNDKVMINLDPLKVRLVNINSLRRAPDPKFKTHDVLFLKGDVRIIVGDIENALKAYSGSMFTVVNEYLRFRPDGYVDEKIENLVTAIDDLFSRAPRVEEDIIVYRGRKHEQGFEKTLAYTSTTKNIFTAKIFISKGTPSPRCCISKIIIKPGVPYIDMVLFDPDQPGEDEILLPRGIYLIPQDVDEDKYYDQFGKEIKVQRVIASLNPDGT
jgi:hypothetical protein